MSRNALAGPVAEALSLNPRSVAAVIALLAEGATVPFIARYRKERTGDLDEVQIRAIQEAHSKRVALEERRSTIRAAIDEQGKLTPELTERLAHATTRAELEDLYLPYKRKRRTRATLARERGLSPLATRILQQPRDGEPTRDAARFVDTNKDVPDVNAALAGARDIVAESVAERPEVRRTTREAMVRHGVVVCRAARGKSKTRSKFEAYYDFREPVSRIPSHRLLAILRGETEGLLKARIEVDAARLERRLGALMGRRDRSPYRRELDLAISDSLSRLLGPSVENGVRGELEDKAHREAVQVFATNLESLLLAPPLGGRAVLGIDPGIRTGCKCAAVDATGRFLENRTLFPKREGAAQELVSLVKTHRPAAVAVGNGTGGRDTESFVRRTLKEAGLGEVLVVSVNEAGASVYSASDIAREEHPDLDLTVRGAISIARRLQDPLAELVKVDPKAIGVGQYQHDVDQKQLSSKLAEVTETCVNRVGVELNTASAPLLSHVAGVGPSLAKKIVAHRDTSGRFSSRAELKRVKGLGPKAFEQCVGFLRVRGGAHALDDSAVHPERYPLVERIARDLDVTLPALAGDPALVAKVNVARYVGPDATEATLRDILRELEKPGRDPRERFEPPKFRDDVQEIGDLREGMSLEGVVTNVTHFGAFVDVGVHQDGLVHISQLADRYVADPNEVVKVGDRLTVRVLSVDLDRRRIGLSAKRG
ncbi:MAG: Tex family protein [Sandaracinaceae bacterium]